MAMPHFTAPVSNDLMVDDVRDRLNRGGYVFEMSVAQEIALRPNDNWQGLHYTRPIKRQERERDL